MSRSEPCDGGTLARDHVRYAVPFDRLLHRWFVRPDIERIFLFRAEAAWLVWKRGGCRAQQRPLTLFLGQLALNAAWTPLFFGLKNPGLARVFVSAWLLPCCFA